MGMAYKELLSRIARQLKPDELETMKFLCTDFIPYIASPQTEQNGSCLREVFQFFFKLEAHDKLGIDGLRGMLKHLDRRELEGEVDTFIKKRNAGNLKSVVPETLIDSEMSKEYIELLSKIAYQLKPDELETMKFLCADFIPYIGSPQTEQNGSCLREVFQFFFKLEAHDKLGIDGLDGLRGMLKHLDRRELEREVHTFINMRNAGNLKSVVTELPSSDSDIIRKPKEYRELLSKIAHQLKPDELETMKFLCADFMPYIASPQTEQNGSCLREVFQFFFKLEAHDKLGIDGLDGLRGMLKHLDRRELEGEVHTFIKKRNAGNLKSAVTELPSSDSDIVVMRKGYIELLSKIAHQLKPDELETMKFLCADVIPYIGSPQTEQNGSCLWEVFEFFCKLEVNDKRCIFAGLLRLKEMLRHLDREDLEVEVDNFINMRNACLFKMSTTRGKRR